MLRFGGDYHMYYWGTGEDGFHRICRAVAPTDAPHEWRFSSSVLGRQAGTAYNAAGPSFPFVVPRDDGPWLMYYGAWGVPRADGKLANTTGLAVSDDRGRTWRHAGESPVLALDRPWDHEGTGSVCVVAEGGVLRMYYTALGDYSPKPAGVATGHGDVIPHIGVGYAESTDGVRWTKPLDGLMVSPRGFATEPFEYIASKPFVLRHDRRWTMWVNTFGTAYRVRSLVSDDGLSWTWTASGPDMYYTALGDYSPKPAGVATGHGDVIPHIGVGYAESTDGVRWTKPLDGLMVSPRGFATEPFEYIASKPFVLRHDRRWTMWVNTFGTAYRVRSLVSDDGLSWTWTASGPDGDLGIGAAGSFDDHQRSYATRARRRAALLVHRQRLRTDRHRLRHDRSVGRGRSPLGIEPRVEQPVQVAFRDLLGNRHEVRGRHVAAGVAGHVLAQHPEERLVADLFPQRVQRHGASLVHRQRERIAGVRISGRSVVRFPYVLPEVVEHLRAVCVGIPQTRDIRRETFVQPDVAPQRGREQVAEPLAAAHAPRSNRRQHQGSGPRRLGARKGSAPSITIAPVESNG